MKTYKYYYYYYYYHEQCVKTISELTEKSSQRVTHTHSLTLELKAIGLGPIQEPDSVIRVSDGPKHVLLLLRDRVVRHNTSLQLGELVHASPNSDQNRSLFLLERLVQNLLDPALSVLERRLEPARAPDSELLDYVAGLEKIAGPLVGSWSAF